MQREGHGPHFILSFVDFQFFPVPFAEDAVFSPVFIFAIFVKYPRTFITYLMFGFSAFLYYLNVRFCAGIMLIVLL